MMKRHNNTKSRNVFFLFSSIRLARPAFWGTELRVFAQSSRNSVYANFLYILDTRLRYTNMEFTYPQDLFAALIGYYFDILEFSLFKLSMLK